MQQEQNLGNATPPSGQAPVTSSAESTQASQPRATYTEDQQAHLNSIVGAKYKEGIEKGDQRGYERGLKEAQERFTQQAPNQPIPPYVPQHQPIQPPQPAQFNEHALQQMIEATAQKIIPQTMQATIAQAQKQFEAKRQQEEAAQLVADLTPKVELAQKKYSDFAEKVNLEAFQTKDDQWFKALNTVDNAGDVMYELVDKPTQFATIEALLNSGNQARINMAKKQLQNLSTSLKNNEASASKKVPNEPLREVRPSKVSSSGDVNLTKASREKYARYF